MSADHTLKEFLNEELLRRMRSNPRYSQRAFARDLGLSAGELSETLRGLRPMTYKGAQKIALKLGLSHYERERLMAAVESGQSSEGGGSGNGVTAKTAMGQPVDMGLFELITDPVTNSLFCLLDVEGFRWDLKWIAKRLGVSQLEIEHSFRKLVKYQVIKRIGRGYQVDLSVLSSPQDVPSVSVRELHRHYLERAKQALDIQDVQTRQINGMSFAVNSQDLPAAKKEISQFIDHIEKKYSLGKRGRDALYHLEVALFRLDRKES